MASKWKDFRSKCFLMVHEECRVRYMACFGFMIDLKLELLEVLQPSWQIFPNGQQKSPMRLLHPRHVTWIPKTDGLEKATRLKCYCWILLDTIGIS